MTYRLIYSDGGNGMCLDQDFHELEPNEAGEVVLDGITYSSRNDDGLLEAHDFGDQWLVPCR